MPDRLATTHLRAHGYASNADPWRCNTSTTTGLTYASLVETMDRLKPIHRDVFVFGGSLNEFKAMMVANGVEVVGDEVGLPRPDRAFYPALFPPLGSLSCFEIDGSVWVAGSYRDIEEARDGKLPFKRLVGGRSHHG